MFSFQSRVFEFPANFSVCFHSAFSGWFDFREKNGANLNRKWKFIKIKAIGKPGHENDQEYPAIHSTEPNESLHEHLWPNSSLHQGKGHICQVQAQIPGWEGHHVGSGALQVPLQ